VAAKPHPDKNLHGSGEPCYRNAPNNDAEQSAVRTDEMAESKQPDEKDFRPRIVAFMCNWCSYTASDLAGTARIKYSPYARIIRVMCSGRVDPTFVLKAFALGADGVMIAGCHPGDCHYIAGNFHARRRFAAFRKLLEFVGVDLNRLQFSCVSAAEGGKWVEVVTDLTEKVRAMGPMTEFKELAMEEQWSGAIDTPELKEAYNQI
jgi:coenzyme F420-reducing hydrogenase delta subunit